MPESKANTSLQEYLCRPCSRGSGSYIPAVFLYGDCSFPDDWEEGDGVCPLVRQKYWEAITAVIHSCTLAEPTFTED